MSFLRVPLGVCRGALVGNHSERDRMMADIDVDERVLRAAVETVIAGDSVRTAVRTLAMTGEPLTDELAAALDHLCVALIRDAKIVRQAVRKMPRGTGESRLIFVDFDKTRMKYRIRRKDEPTYKERCDNEPE